MAKGYTTEALVENFLLKTIDSSFSGQITSWIEGAERYIDKVTGRNFVADEEATARLYSGDGEQDLLIDDAVEITKVEVGEDDYGGTFSEIASTGADRYFTDPENAAAKGVPVTKITLRTRRWPKGKQNNRITAKWGYSAEVPADIQFAATVLVAGIINAQTQDGEEIKSEKIGEYQVTYNSEKGRNSLSDFERAMEILQAYKKYTL